MKQMEKQELKKLPIMFQKLQQYDVEKLDTRFLKVKIWIMHLGENYNGSYFDKEVVTDAIPSLANTPILCFIEEDENGNKDFSDHRMELVIEDNKIKQKYLGSAIGLIPETNNAQFEKRICDDGVEREFLTVEGLIWTKWDEPLEIFEKNNIKGQSMELNDDYEGEFEKDNLFHFSKISFFGACILGDDVCPAMQNSTIQVNFENNNVFSTIQDKFEQFKQYINNSQGGNKQVKRDEILTKFSYLKGAEFDAIVNDKSLSDEDLENKLFALSNKQIEKAIREELKTQKVLKKYYDGEAYETNKYFLEDVVQSENIVIVEDNESYGVFYGIPYTIEGDKATLDYTNAKRYVRGDWREFNDGQDQVVINPSYSEFEKQLNTKYQALKDSFVATETEEYKGLLEKFNALETENNELKQFKQYTLDAQKEDKINSTFAKFSELEGMEGFNKLKENAKNMEIEDLEMNLFALLGKKNFSAKKSNAKKINDTIKVPATNFATNNDDVKLSEAERRYGIDIYSYLK